MTYEVRDADGNVVATFTTDAPGPFKVYTPEAGEAPMNGGGGGGPLEPL